MSKQGFTSLPSSSNRKSDDLLQLSRRTESILTSQPLDFALIHIMRLALSIERDPAVIDDWFLSAAIRELGGLTAQQLVAQGDAKLVIEFLWSIRRGERG